MELIKEVIGGRECLVRSCDSPEFILVQPVDDHDIEVLSDELDIIGKESGARFSFLSFKVNDWNVDLSPWEAAPIYGDTPFGSGAEDTLSYILESLIPEVIKGCDGPEPKVIIGGYSLAAFFSLWAVYKTDAFDAAACASPSVWFPGWLDFARDNSVKAGKVYLSLGKKEEKTRNPVMSKVGDNIKETRELIAGSGIECALEWNEGNHFRDPDKRTARAFCWCMGNE